MDPRLRDQLPRQTHSLCLAGSFVVSCFLGEPKRAVKDTPSSTDRAWGLHLAQCERCVCAFVDVCETMMTVCAYMCVVRRMLDVCGGTSDNQQVSGYGGWIECFSARA